jgi:hypothetical protein
MSRDRRDRPEANDPAVRAAPGGEPADRERSAELLTAYVDGVAELPADERRAIERWLTDDPRARADADAVHALLGQLRALPPDYDGGEPPDWPAMERSIRQAVAAVAPRPWWRSWRWLVPAMTCAAAAALALWPRPAPAPVVVAEPDRATPPIHPPPPGDEVVALWLDGSEVDVDLSRPGALGDMLGAAPRAEQTDAANETGDEIGLLPAAGMAWIDDLDDAALDRAERALANPSTGAAGPARSED